MADQPFHYAHEEALGQCRRHVERIAGLLMGDPTSSDVEQATRLAGEIVPALAALSAVKALNENPRVKIVDTDAEGVPYA